MSLIISQGKQDTTQDNKFNPIVAQDVMLQITELKLAKNQPNTLEVTLRVLDGQFKNRFIFDRVTFDSTSPMSWKYRQLRKCAGVPYQDNEPLSIDIEALLLNKAVKADLGIRKGKNQDGEEQDYQNIKYKVLNTSATISQPGSVFSQEPTQPVTKKVAKPKVATVVESPEKPTVIAHDTGVNETTVNITDEDEWD